MKFFFFLCLLSPFALLAQDCQLIKGKDDISGKPTLSTGFMDLPGATLSIDVRSREIDFFFVLDSHAVKCLDEETEAVVMFEGGKQKTQFKNSGSLNCDGIFHIIFKNSAFTPSALTRLGAKKIVGIQITGSSFKPFALTLNAQQQVSLQNSINCVIREAKSVL
jgi:hypothetical protein